MGQLQRDDRRRVQQETVELWEIGQEELRPSQSGQSRQTGQSQRRRPPQQMKDSRKMRELRQIGEPHQKGRSHRERELQRARQPHRKRDVQKIRQSRQEGRPRQRDAQQVRRQQEIDFRQQVRPSVPPGNPRPVQSIKRRRARRRKVLLSRAGVFLFIVLCLVLIYQTVGAVYRFLNRDVVSEVSQENKGIITTLSDKMNGKKIAPPEMVEDYLEINDYSRPGTKLRNVKSVFVHYTANQGTSAQNNRSYFANLAETHERAASAHLIIGYEGEMIKCIPLDEQAYGVKGRNDDSLSIECCYLEEDGSFTPETYETLIHTLAWLLEEYDLTTEDILRHYDCGGKMCPLYYVEHEDAWEKLLADVGEYIASAE